ncbi:MAG: type VI secretion system ATPase TssH [Saccharospirillum sp.]|nr:type VI secretion system ATPase TssH [Saccharospirillum sp.]
MIHINIKGLVAKLNPTLRDTLEGAAGLAMANSQYNVEIEHWLSKLLEHPDTDLIKIAEAYDLDSETMARQLTESIEGFKKGNTRPPALSQTLVDLVTQSWLLASAEYGHPQVTSGHLITAALLDGSLSVQLKNSITSLSSLSGEALKSYLPTIVGTTSESALIQQQESNNRGASGAAQADPMAGSALKRFTVDLTEKARGDDIDPVLGRDQEIRQLIDVLMRRRQNNPILTGEPGVGKTAVVEGLAQRIVKDDVPTPIKGVKLLSLDMGLLEAGASVKGEFENRLKAVIQEVKDSPDPIIMFIDEAHTLIGAGGREGQGDAANLMKPALARGEFRTIAATTLAEYKKYFEKDPALTRRFQVVNVEEPDEVRAINMMRGIARSLEQHHKIMILDEAIEAAVKLSSRYIPARHLPDKAVSLLDTACARVALSQEATPASIEDAQKSVEQLKINLELFEQEQLSQGGLDDKISQYQTELTETEQRLAELEAQWQKEQEKVSAIQALFKQRAEQPDDAAITEQLNQARTALATLQGESPMVYLSVDANAIASVVANWTGIPVGRMMTDQLKSVLALEDRLRERVVGQDHALHAVAEAIRTSRAGLMDPRKPIGVFLMIGTSGAGKTETALALAEALYGGEQNLITLNMSEFKEEHKVSMLLGAPAGYVGYGEGGVLTEAVRRKPYSVVLLDEMEKAHPGIQDVFYNLFDKGTIKDGEGRDIDFRNTVVIMTSNACSGSIAEYCERNPVFNDKELLEAVRPELLGHFRPAFLGRTTIIPYSPLSREVLATIVGINMKRIERRVREQYGATFSYDDAAVQAIVDRCQDPDTGARNVENVISRSILPELATQCLGQMAEGHTIGSVHIALDDQQQRFTYQLS